jgi:phosphoribosylformylglycinamidine synthase I
LPPRQMLTQVSKAKLKNPVLNKTLDLQTAVTQLLQRPSLASTAFISQQFDHEVQATSVLKPLQGKGRVNADTTVIRPRPETHTGVAVSQALYPTLSEIDAYTMAASSIDAAIRNLIVAGAPLDKIALLDNFCWCSSTEPERLGQLKAAAKACYDLALAYQTPFISGKDSMFNDFKGFDAQGQPIKISVPPTLLISSLAVVEDVRKVVSIDTKAAGDLIYLLGETEAELGGSEYFRLLAEKQGSSDFGKALPTVQVEKNRALYKAYTLAIDQGLVVSGMSLGLGGLVTGLAKMSLAGQLGATINLGHVPGSWKTEAEALFAETQGRILVSIRPEHRNLFETLFKNSSCAQLGEVVAEPTVTLKTKLKSKDLSWSLNELGQAYFSTSPSTHSTVSTQVRAQKRLSGQPQALVLTGYGINCEEETATAFEQAGAVTEIKHINDLIAQPSLLKKFEILAVPGGFSYGDDTGSGNAYAQKLKVNLWPELQTFVSQDKLVIGICNGCQVLVNLGLIPATNSTYGQRDVALIHNDNALYTDRWVDLNIEGQGAWLQGMSSLMVPIAHGEGKFYAPAQVLAELERNGQVGGRYVAGEVCHHFNLPVNPNGSLHNIAALTDPTGRVLGIMPHPERAISFTQLPHWTYLKQQYQRQGQPIPEVGPGLRLFKNAVEYFTES